MPELPSMSPIQFNHSADGQVQIVGLPDVPLKMVGGRASPVFPEWERTLGLPTYQEQWEALAKASRLTPRYIRFILCDESPTKLVGNIRLQPSKIRLRPGPYLFTLGHTGFAIGLCRLVALYPKEEPARAFLNLPTDTEGDCLVGTAEFYDSRLADIAIRGLQQGIFSHACAVVFMKPGDPDGAGILAEIALTTDLGAGCVGARILKTWEEPLAGCGGIGKKARRGS